MTEQDPGTPPSAPIYDALASELLDPASTAWSMSEPPSFTAKVAERTGDRARKQMPLARDDHEKDADS